MGALHPYEQALTLLLAFGPFVVLGVVIWRRRREEDDSAVPDEELACTDAPSPIAEADRHGPLS
jgi:hypothetical protein